MAGMEQKLTDFELVTRTVEGDRSCFDALVEKYRDQIYRLVYFKVNNTDEAYDLAQDTFVAAYESLRQLREYSKFGPWLRSIAENVCNMWLRRNRFDFVVLEDSADPSQSLDRYLSQSRISAAISGLSETNQPAAQMFFIEGYTQREIADHLDLPLTTIKRRINLSRTQLRKELIDMAPESSKQNKIGREFNAGVTSKIDVIRWYQELSKYIAAGTTLVRALDLLSRGDFPEQIKNETAVVIHEIEQGRMMSEALELHAPSLKMPRAAGMIRSGEVAGNLEWYVQAMISWTERENLSLKLEAAYWLRSFSRLLASGVPIFMALDIMKGISAPESLSVLPDKIKENVLAGKRLSEAFVESSEVFSPAVRGLISAGETSGTLEISLLQAASLMLNDLHRMIQTDPGHKACDAKPEIVDQLRAQLLQPVVDVRLGALQALEYNLGSEVITDCISMLHDTDPLVRTTAVELIERHPADAVIQPLLSLLDDDVATVRCATLRAIAAISAAQCLDSAKRMLTDSSSDVRIAALSIVGRSDQADAAEIITKALEDGDCLVVNAATEELKKLGQPAVQAIVEAIHDGRPLNLQAALDTLLELDRSRAREAAIWLLQNEVPDSRASAIGVIAAVADPSDSQILIEALSDDNNLTDYRAATGLGEMRSTVAVTALITALNSRHEDVQIKAAQALGKIGDNQAAPALAAKLSSDNPRTVVVASLDALAELKTTEYAPVAADMIFQFARKGYNVGMGVVELVGQTEIGRLVEALDDPELSGSAANYLAWVVRKRENGKEMVKAAGAVPAFKHLAKEKNMPWLNQMIQTLES